MTCEHLELKKCLVGETELYKCRECKRNFTARPLKIEVKYARRLRQQAESQKEEAVDGR